MLAPWQARNYFTTMSGQLSDVAQKWVRDLLSKVDRPLFPLPPIYANNAAAITGGLKAGDMYRTGANPDVICVVH